MMTRMYYTYPFRHFAGLEFPYWSISSVAVVRNLDCRASGSTYDLSVWCGKLMPNSFDLVLYPSITLPELPIEVPGLAILTTLSKHFHTPSSVLKGVKFLVRSI